MRCSLEMLGLDAFDEIDVFGAGNFEEALGIPALARAKHTGVESVESQGAVHIIDRGVGEGKAGEHPAFLFDDGIDDDQNVGDTEAPDFVAKDANFPGDVFEGFGKDVVGGTVVGVGIEYEGDENGIHAAFREDGM